MNDDIESLLQSLGPAKPSAALTRSVDHELEQDLSWAGMPKRAPNFNWFAPVMWTSIGAAAAVMAMSAVGFSSVNTGSYNIITSSFSAACEHHPRGHGGAGSRHSIQ
jgi:hypothetical protein